jgi:hypothetical protein
MNFSDENRRLLQKFISWDRFYQALKSDKVSIITIDVSRILGYLKEIRDALIESLDIYTLEDDLLPNLPINKILLTHIEKRLILTTLPSYQKLIILHTHQVICRFETDFIVEKLRASVPRFPRLIFPLDKLHLLDPYLNCFDFVSYFDNTKINIIDIESSYTECYPLLKTLTYILRVTPSSYELTDKKAVRIQLKDEIVLFQASPQKEILPILFCHDTEMKPLKLKTKKIIIVRTENVIIDETKFRDVARMKTKRFLPLLL